MGFIDWIRTVYSSVRQSTDTGGPEAQQVEALQRFIARGWLSDRRYDADDLTVMFLLEFLPQKNPHRPNLGESLRRWKRRSNLPIEIKRLCDLAHGIIGGHFEELRKQEEMRSIAEGRRKAVDILRRNSGRVDKFLEIAYRKVSAPDEYGDEHPEVVDEEISRFIRKLADTEVELKGETRHWLDSKIPLLLLAWSGPITTSISEILQNAFTRYYSLRKARLDTSATSTMSGVDFELHISGLLRSVGVKYVSITTTSGDQGADLLFTWKGKRFVVQAKRYSGSVGNKAVQEVHAAKGFYGCDRAWVITDSRFTSSARKLAKELDVVLVDGNDLGNFAAFARLQLEG